MYAALPSLVYRLNTRLNSSVNLQVLLAIVGSEAVHVFNFELDRRQGLGRGFNHVFA